jgi:hypothetical protein
MPQTGRKPIHVLTFQIESQFDLRGAFQPLLPAEHLLDQGTYRDGDHLVVDRMVAG